MRSSISDKEQVYNNKVKSISGTFKTAFEAFKARGWDHIYVLVDVHGVMMKANYGGVSREIYPDCIMPLRTLSEDPKVKLIMWTCSNHRHVEIYNQIFADLGINFDYTNENPEVDHKEASGDYSVKLYANVIMDDKGGFEPDVDWNDLDAYLQSDEYKSLCLTPKHQKQPSVVQNSNEEATA